MRLPFDRVETPYAGTCPGKARQHKSWPTVRRARQLLADDPVSIGTSSACRDRLVGSRQPSRVDHAKVGTGTRERFHALPVGTRPANAPSRVPLVLHKAMRLKSLKIIVWSE